MAHFSSFEDLVVYKEATLFCDAIWLIMCTTPLQKDYKLREQINGSSGSIMDNIAEGFGRGGNKEFIMFLGFSRGSCTESKAQLLRAYRRAHISEETYHSLNIKAQNLIDQLSKFINYLKKSERRGSKFD
ncbi:four helix bundle protein [Gelidibacter algens]|jgi:four helix bundle protein|uniref:Four helix bundle protein n=1 Tax=Gelidibacter algens TaxID=49280 RepID=A0A1A7R265_9FLAO|nr:four helix bundle protein [Gelidibacter algens]OBX26355.1 four helix bundle protein [Gelidibacter algens]RAJ25867.1 four helix bundle protein [Gelidibacter algens]